MDAFSVLREDHETVLALFEELEAGLADPKVDAERQRARDRLATELVIAESRHETVEQQYFWPSVRRALADGDDLASRALDQEDAAEQVLAGLDEASVDGPDFDRLIAKIIKDGREHIEFEETVVWPKVKAALSRAELEDLGAKMAAASEKAPTRPHPATPSNATVRRTAGRVAAAVDRARDAATGRGRA